ncbi:MAG TPA: hypothetical protein DGG95_09165, partial [Cytophagales bacterium]|nr:hypothetical protein [Cytophagales bacterium]
MKVSSVVVFLLLSLPLLAQESSVFGTNPASIKWYQINTPNFRLLYPQGFEAQAQRMANTLESLHEPEAKSMLTKRNGGMEKLPRKISIV